MKLPRGVLQIQRTGFLILILMMLLTACSSVQEAIGVGQPAPDFSLPTADGGSVALDDFIGQQPVLRLMNERTIEALDEALQKLPLRQQQAFMLRIWEGLNVEQTAQAMNCSQGSVKTHFSRAVHSLRDQLEDHR